MGFTDPLVLGTAAGLATALCWAGGSLLFSRIAVPAAGMNLFKNGFGSLLIIGTLCVLALFRGGGPVVTYGSSAWAWLALSSVFGLLIGDTLYFRSIQILGPRKALVMSLSVPPLAALASWWALGEEPGGRWAGMAVTLVGVAWVIRERTGNDEKPGIYPGSTVTGVFCAIGGSICQAVGSVWSKLGLRGDAFPGLEASPAMPELDASLVRLGVAFLAGLIVYARVLPRWIAAMRPHLGRLMLASTLGTFFGIWLSLVAYRNTPLSIATTLTSLTPVFVIPLLRIFFGTRVSWRACIGVVVALAGVLLLVEGGFSG